MARANWEWIKVDVLLPGHPKLAGLSRSARWTLIELWCHSGSYHTDGWVNADVWKAIGSKAERDAIVKARLAEPAPMGGYIMHDYTEHQRSKEEIEEASAARSDKARKAAEARWGKQMPG